MGLWADLLIIQTMVGYCFVIANFCIGMYNIKDLNKMKGDIIFVKAHKFIGRIETLFFYAISIQCIAMMLYFNVNLNPFVHNVTNSGGMHILVGGYLAGVFFTLKFVIAFFFKDTIYKFGQYIGPIGFIGWNLGHWTSIANYYALRVQVSIFSVSLLFAVIVPIIIGISIFLTILVFHGGTGKSGFSAHQIAFILHGVTFGYEKATKELLGTPALFKYVVPKTYEFLDKMMGVFGIDLKKFETMNLNDALDEFKRRTEEIGMSEKIEIKWQSDKEFSVESVNCSTSSVRSVMSKEELENAICPWAIMTASLVSKITGKELVIDPSEFNEIGALTRLRFKD